MRLLIIRLTPLSALSVNQIPLVSQTSSASRPDIHTRNPRPRQRNTVGHYVKGRAANADVELTQVRGFQNTTGNTLSEVAMEGHGDSKPLLGWFCRILRRDNRLHLTQCGQYLAGLRRPVQTRYALPKRCCSRIPIHLRERIVCSNMAFRSRRSPGSLSGEELDPCFIASASPSSFFLPLPPC